MPEEGAGYPYAQVWTRYFAHYTKIRSKSITDFNIKLEKFLENTGKNHFDTGSSQDFLPMIFKHNPYKEKKIRRLDIIKFNYLQIISQRTNTQRTAKAQLRKIYKLHGLYLSAKMKN